MIEPNTISDDELSAIYRSFEGREAEHPFVCLLLGHISALVREKDLRREGEFPFSRRKALVERCAALVEMLESQVNPLRADAGAAKQALKEAAAFIRANGLKIC